jgi:hypothetical protein
MMNTRQNIIIAVGILLIFASGCAKKEAGKVPVLAKINNYELTVRDFQDEARLIRGSKGISTNPMKAKEDFLKELIVKQILIQEAQKMNFDKDKAFMKEIERYWEQALLKLLLKKKSEELVGVIDVSPKEVQDEYKKMKDEDPSIAGLEKIAPQIREELLDRKRTQALGAWIDGLRKNARVNVNEKILENIRLK